MDLQAKLTDWENLCSAYARASRGKRGRASPLTPCPPAPIRGSPPGRGVGVRALRQISKSPARWSSAARISERGALSNRPWPAA